MTVPSDRDVFRVLLETLPFEKDSQMISSYIEAVNASLEGGRVRYINDLGEAGDDLVEEIATGHHTFGWVAYPADLLRQPRSIREGLTASVQLLAVILENRRLKRQQDLIHQAAEQAQREVEQEKQEIISGAGEGIILYDRELRYRLWNRFMEEITGLPASEVLGKPALELFPHLREQGLDELLRRALAGETVESPDTRYYVPNNGRSGWMTGRYRPHYSTSGEIIGVVGIIRDITLRKDSEEMLLRERDLLSQVMETSPAGIVILNRKYQITFANRRAEKVLGLKRNPTLNGGIIQPAWKIYDQEGQLVPREKLPYAQVMNTGQPVYRSQHMLELEDGRRALVSVNASPLHNASGDIEGVIAVVEDMTERRKAEAALGESEERYALAVSGANDGIWDWDLKTGRVYYSPRWEAIIGHDNGAFAEKIEEWFNRVHPGDYWQFKADINAHLNGETPHLESEHRILHRDGQYRWVLARGMAVRDAGGKAYRMAGSLTDVTRQKIVEERLRHDAMHDPLTHLPNRAFFIDQVRRAIDRARRNPDYQGAVLYLDLDRFKLINETLGHSSGDQLLVAIARRLQAIIHPRDVVSRFGGDEFAILLDDIVGVGDATRTAQRIQEELTFPFKIQDHELYPGASIGIAMITTSSYRAEDILRDADTAMYRAKAGGRGRHQVFGTEMHAMNVALFELEAELRRAVERNQFQLYYQPIVSLKSGHISSVEALVRWHHPRRGLILPGEFIILAEETGLILSIGEWVLRTACRQAMEWRDAGYLELRVSVNISPRQMQEPEYLPALVATVLEESGLPAKMLQLEVTEWAAMQNMDQTVQILQEISQMGVLISIDDFGTSYSSLGYLKRFPITTIKIDQSFVRDMTEDPDDAAITKAIIAMGNVLGLDVVAEGVEMEDQLVMLIPEKCDEVQGDLLGRPVPSEAITSLLQEGHPLLPEIYFSSRERPLQNQHKAKNGQ